MDPILVQTNQKNPNEQTSPQMSWAQLLWALQWGCLRNTITEELGLKHQQLQRKDSFWPAQTICT